MTLMTNEDRHEYRYEERAGVYAARAWNNGREISENRPVSERPKWLTDIIAIAVAGGHAKKVPTPPPEFIVWFRVNGKQELIEFIDFNNTLEGTADEL